MSHPSVHDLLMHLFPSLLTHYLTRVLLVEEAMGKLRRLSGLGLGGLGLGGLSLGGLSLDGLGRGGLGLGGLATTLLPISN